MERGRLTFSSTFSLPFLGRPSSFLPFLFLHVKDFKMKGKKSKRRREGWRAGGFLKKREGRNLGVCVHGGRRKGGGALLLRCH